MSISSNNKSIMVNTLFLEVYTSYEDYKESLRVFVPLESFITYCVYKFCAPDELLLNFVFTDKTGNGELVLRHENLTFIHVTEIPWQVSSCVYPVILYRDTIITGLCAVARHISKFRIPPQTSFEHNEGLLGFRKSCLQAPNEVSIWTKFCEVDVIRTVKEMLSLEKVQIVPKNVVRFENHLNKPVRVHNVYKIAREIRKENLKLSTSLQSNNGDVDQKLTADKSRFPKSRKWKSNNKKELEIDSSSNITELGITHEFAEGPYLTLADLILLPSYHIIIQLLGENFVSLMPLTHKWYMNLINIPQIQPVKSILCEIRNNFLVTESLVKPTTEDVSLYKCDPKRHNPKKRLFTKPEDIENALSALVDGLELNVDSSEFDFQVNWDDIPNGANPTAGHLPDERVLRKSQQLENLARAVLNIAKDGDLIVDFCSGSGHLGILIAHLLPKCTVILLENKEQSLLRARKRVHEMNLSNVLFFQCNLDFFIGKFDIGIALHACGIASDLVLDKCLKAKAKFVLCPCCYGSLHATDRLIYPRSNKFKCVSVDQYLCIGHAADQTHEEHPMTVRGDRCMAIIDSDRARLAEEFGYKVTLSRLKPLTCTPKNNLLIGVPS